MAILVMIAGGWRGGWTYARLAAALRAEGHEVHTPTLTGLDDDPAIRDPIGGVNLETHIHDVLELITVEDLYDVVLVSHSYGGMVATAVADRVRERVSALVYLDAFVPDNGQSWWDVADDGFRNLVVARARHDGFSVMPPEGGNRDPRRAPHPLATFLQELHLSGRERTVETRVFVYASGWAATPFTPQYERLRADPAWQVHTIDCGHDLANDAPDAVMTILRQVIER